MATRKFGKYTASIKRNPLIRGNTYYVTRNDGVRVSIWYNFDEQLWVVYAVDVANDLTYQCGGSEYVPLHDVEAAIGSARHSRTHTLDFL